MGWRRRVVRKSVSGLSSSVGMGSGRPVVRVVPRSRVRGVSVPAQSNGAHAGCVQLARGLGVSHYRYAFEFGWGLEAFDSVVGSCRAAGLKLVLCVFRSDRVVPVDAVGRTVFAEQVAQLVERGQGIVSHVEVWNEPNHFPFVTVKDPVRWAALVVAVSARLRAAFPGVKIISGGVSPEPSPFAPHEFVWAAASQPGFLDAIDMIGWHPYCFPHNPMGSESWNAMRQAVTVWEEIKSSFGRDVPFAATEYGAPSAWQGFMESTQAQWFQDYWTAFESRGPKWELVSPFMVQDGNAGTGASWEPSTGLFRADGSEKPAAAVYRGQR